jgi:hypothetical protein
MKPIKEKRLRLYIVSRASVETLSTTGRTNIKV